MDKAIRLAIEKGGYRYIKQHICKGSSWTGGAVPDYDKTVLDPLFWHSLEKPLGWYAGEGKQKAIDYFVCLFEGGDTEKYWSELLKTHSNASRI